MLNNILKLSLIVTLISVSFIYPQQKLFLAKNVEKAFVNETRSPDGNPGLNYWQNSSDYKIIADINPHTRILKGNANIVYHNNSPDILKNIVIRLYQNINKATATRDFNLRPGTTNDGMIIQKLFIDNTEYNLGDAKEVSVPGTNMIVTLRKPIAPNTRTELSINWEFQLPAGPSIRIGAYDSTSFFIAYWYPQIAVYDDIDGWDRNEYTGNTEFYNDFSNFDVELSVPNTFGVWATGILDNPDKIFSEKIISRYKQASRSDEIIHIITKEDLTDYNLFNNESSNNTWHYIAESVPDFAFGFSDHYLWDASSILVDSLTGRRVYVAAVYKEASLDFYDICEASRNVINHFSNKMPAAPYPYPAMTVFNGAGGMEFPMIVNNGSESSYERAASLAAHEIAHTYFPFYMGTNERKYAWMDEGYAVFFTNDFQENNLAGYSERNRVVAGYERVAGNETELPLMIPSTQMKGATYRIAAYNKPSIAYQILRQLLGDELYLKTLKEFINRWKGKHPVPHDFFNTFNNVTGQDLSWFWQPWFFEQSYPDLAIESHKVVGNELFVKVKRVGDLPIPVVLTCFNSIGEKYTYRKEASIWKNDVNEFEMKLIFSGNPVQIMLGDETVPDVNRSDNVINLQH